MPYGQRRAGPSATAELALAFAHQLEHCRLEPGETVAVVSDSAFDPSYGATCMGAALGRGAEAFQLLLPHRRPWPEATLSAAFGAADVIVYCTTHALHYSEAMREALAAGKRALMAVVPPHVLERRLASEALTARTKAGAGYFDRGAEVRIRSEAGTDLSLNIAGRRGVASYGAADEPGHLDFWGAGCFQVAPVEGSVEGRLVLGTGDQVFHFARYVDRPVTIEFEKGRAVSFSGGAEAEIIRRHLLDAGEPEAFLAGHIAVGTDPLAKWTAEASQFPVAGGGGADAEAYYGNVQVELGSNDDVMFGGRNRSSVHLGLCCLDASLTIDGAPIVERGDLVPDELHAERSPSGETTPT